MKDYILLLHVNTYLQHIWSLAACIVFMVATSMIILSCKPASWCTLVCVTRGFFNRWYKATVGVLISPVFHACRHPITLYYYIYLSYMPNTLVVVTCFVTLELANWLTVATNSHNNCLYCLLLHVFLLFCCCLVLSLGALLQLSACSYCFKTKSCAKVCRVSPAGLKRPQWLGLATRSLISWLPPALCIGPRSENHISPEGGYGGLLRGGPKAGEGEIIHDNGYI